MDGFLDLKTPEGLDSFEKYLCDFEQEANSDEEENMFDCSDVFLENFNLENNIDDSIDAFVEKLTLSSTTSTPVRSNVKKVLSSSDDSSYTSANSDLPPILNGSINGSASLDHLDPTSPVTSLDGLENLFQKLSIKSPPNFVKPEVHPKKVSSWLNNNSFNEKKEFLDLHENNDDEKNDTDKDVWNNDVDDNSDNESFTTAAESVTGIEMLTTLSRDIFIHG